MVCYHHRPIIRPSRAVYRTIPWVQPQVHRASTKLSFSTPLPLRPCWCLHRRNAGRVPDAGLVPARIRETAPVCSVARNRPKEAHFDVFGSRRGAPSSGISEFQVGGRPAGGEDEGVASRVDVRDFEL